MEKSERLASIGYYRFYSNNDRYYLNNLQEVQLKLSNVRVFLWIWQCIKYPIFIRYVTKDGDIAGPRHLEHMVDVVLLFEGDRKQQIRILRTEKNRFGSTNEVGIFEMKNEGLVEVKNPSEIFLTEENEIRAGSAIVVTMEGTRPILAEVQALVVPSTFNYPRRMAVGIDTNRVILLSAVLERK